MLTPDQQRGCRNRPALKLKVELREVPADRQVRLRSAGTQQRGRKLLNHLRRHPLLAVVRRDESLARAPRTRQRLRQNLTHAIGA